MDFQQFSNPSWRRTAPETFAAFAKAAAVLEGKPRPGLAPDEEADLRFCYRTIIAGFTAKLHPVYLNLVRWICQSPFRFRSVLRIVRRHRHFRLNPPSPSAEDWKRTTDILNGKLELLNQTIRHEHERTRRKIEGTETYASICSCNVEPGMVFR